MHRYFIAYTAISPNAVGNTEIHWPRPIAGHQDITKIGDAIARAKGLRAGTVIVTNYQRFEDPTPAT